MTAFLGYDMDPGLIPLVVGVVSTLEGLDKAASASTWPCDVIEIRLDLIGPENVEWALAAHRLTQAGVGTLLTIRHNSEGGRWSDDETIRLHTYLDNLQHVTGVDVELDSEILPDLIAAARDRVTVIGSHHNFRKMPTPAELQATLKRGHDAGVDVVKIAAFASDRNELNRLVKFVEKNSDKRLCALAMGPMGEESRISLPKAGSCLTYGYLDKPNAPGQPSAADLRDKLMAQHEEYRVFAEIRAGM